MNRSVKKLRITFTTLACAVMALAPAGGWAATPAEPPNALTIYSTSAPGAIGIDTLANLRGAALPGYAVVRHLREMVLTRGRNVQRFTDVAALIDPTTVSFESLTDPAGTRVLDQSFQFDLISAQRLLERYLEREISVDQVRGTAVETFDGVLLSTQGGLTLRRPDGSIRILPGHAGIRLPELPGGLITRPTLVWSLDAQRAASHRTRVSYQTRGIAWWADYNLTYSEPSPGQCALDAAAWVSIVNQSGASYPDARLKLVAGDVQRLPVARPRPGLSAQRAELAAAAPPGFEQKEFFEYHLYTLGRSVTLPDNSTQQLELFPAARGVGCTKTLGYYGLGPGYQGVFPRPVVDRELGSASNRKVDVYLSFRNAENNRLGMPLPAGRVRVSQLDPADRTLEFIGEDTIDHTPRDETVRIRLGSAFDVVGERRQVDFRVDNAKREMVEEIEVKVRNQKKAEPVTVQVRENLYRWTNWQITQRSHAFDRIDARTVHFPVTIAPGAETIVRYSVRYTW
ncbi:MAG: DUF4139 domain-containing protein [Proteobacteria bacterium]|nr:DUF4139 domain-containing protein [Burkholderiales bacterium]